MTWKKYPDVTCTYVDMGIKSMKKEAMRMMVPSKMMYEEKSQQEFCSILG